jgi:ubiquitin carboxyl-terminal hydrolase 8
MTTNIIFNPCCLANLGNTCFLNTCVQLLNYTNELADISLPSYPDNSDIVRVAEYSVFAEWLELRKMMMDAYGKIPNPVASPGKFVHTIHNAATIKGYGFGNWTQNDLSDFLQFILECIHNSKKRAVVVNIKQQSSTSSLEKSSESNEDDLALECYSMLKNNYEKGDYSEILSIFGGMHVSRLYKQDNTVSNTPESFCVLHLPIPLSAKEGNTSINLTDCIELFMSDEILSDWKNETTGQLESIRKNMAFWSFPNILIFTLKRHSPDGLTKNNVLVDYPIELDLSSYVVGYKANTYKYRLYGVGNHMGDISHGHYNAFIHTNDKWYCIDDQTAFELNRESIVSPCASCIFYRKI